MSSAGTIIAVTLLVVVLLLFCKSGRAQLPAAPIMKDSSGKIELPDSLLLRSDKLFFPSIPTPAKAAGKISGSIKATVKIPAFSYQLKKDGVAGHPLVKLNGGYVNYNFLYHSYMDTPYVEKDISQHVITGNINVVAANYFPVKVNYWIRRSNSLLFRNVTDVQVIFDPAGFRNNMLQKARQRKLSAAGILNDSLVEKLYAAKVSALKNAAGWLHNLPNAQKLREYKEIIEIPTLTYKANLPDSINRQRADSIQKQARLFIEIYHQTKGRYDSLLRQTDSLKAVLEKIHSRLLQYQQLLKGQPADWASYGKWKDQLKAYEPAVPDAADKYRWLMGIRSLSAGRTPVNASELTAKNISITGVNFEYNSWYYLAVTAGLVDYRFRDFVVNRLNTAPQYLYLLRLGIGRLEKNYVILSAFRGRKQLYATTGNGVPASVSITGLGIEAKWQVHQTTYISAESAQSLSPDARSTPPSTKGTFSLTDNINKALSLKFHSWLPKTGSLLEGMYKYTGANYQSFSSFQTSAAMKTWYLKGEQSFFHRQLRITGALRSNEFSNPYIPQNYKSNTVFKSINVALHRKGWPAVTVGYVPMSQLTVIDQQVVENRFQTLTASMNHFYRLGIRQASSTIVYNRFYNNSSDTGFIYFNSVNLFYAQNFLFNHFAAGMAASHSTSRQYELNVLDGNIHLNLKQFSIGAGGKVNSLNRVDTRAGAYLNANLRLSAKDILYISYDHGYLPGNGKRLVNNDTGSIQYSRAF